MVPQSFVLKKCSVVKEIQIKEIHLKNNNYWLVAHVDSDAILLVNLPDPLSIPK